MIQILTYTVKFLNSLNPLNFLNIASWVLVLFAKKQISQLRLFKDRH